MWKNWSLFKRRTEDNSNLAVNQDVTTDGKENSSDMNRRARDVGGNMGVYNQFGESNSNGDVSLNNCSFSQVNGYNNSSSCVQSSFEQESLRQLSGGRATDHVNGSGLNTPQQRRSTILKRPAASLTQTDSSNLPRSATDGMNQSFSGVYGPLLSSPIVPKVRRALESSTGLRSPQTGLLSRGKPIGRSSSLNYGSGNPVKSSAGKVPWVRLKKKESLTLTDIANGTTPQSPNTVKLAAPEQKHLPAAPSFKTTPLIVTTEHSRARVVDTQAVVSALREKRKRFGGCQRDDTFSEDSWMNAAKRRRQDSGQSNASSVSIPSMPESLPDLMGTPGVSLLHIENLTDQRPSTVPAMDAFVSRHQREFGLGGDLLGQSPQLQVYNQPPLQELPASINKQSSKSVLRSIQSSLSSSIRARTNLATLQNSGLDLTRIRQVPESRDAPRRPSVSFDGPVKDLSSADVQPPVMMSTPIIAAAAKTSSSLADKSTLGGSVAKGMTPLSTRQKIAEGVVLKKQNLSISSTSTPVKPKQVAPLNMLISTNDIEQDRQKEYKRRVLDLLNEDESVSRSGVSSAPSLSIMTAPTTPSLPATITSLGLPVVTTAASSAATVAAVSASLDSLNKLVQSATAGSGLSLSAAASAAVMTSSTNSLAQGFQPSSVSGSSLASSAPSKEVPFGFITSSATPQTTSTELSSTTASSATGGFKFGASTSAASSLESTKSTTAATTSGFQISFPPASVSTGAASTAAGSVASTPSAVSMGSGQPAGNGGFSFGLGSTSGSQPSTGFGSSSVSQPTSGFGSSSQPNTDVGSTSASQTNAFFGLGSGPQSGSGFGSAAGSQTSTGIFGSNLGSQASTNSGFNFGPVPASQTSSAAGGPATSAPVFSGMSQTTSLSSASGANQVNGSLQNPNLSFKAPSTQTATVNTQVSMSSGGLFGSGISQPALSSAPFSLSSTLQAFAASQPNNNSPFTNQTNGTLGQSFAPNAAPLSSAASFSASAAPATSTPGMFNFGASNTTAPPAAGFSLGSSGGGAKPQGTATVMSSSFAPSAAGGTAGSSFGFNFGGSATTTASQQPNSLSFGAAPASSQPAASGLTSQGQPSFTGFGLNTQNNASTSAFTSGGLQQQGLFTSASAAPTSQPFGSGGAFGSGSQTSLTAQQSFGSSAAAPGLSMFGAAPATTAATNMGIFNFGQTSAPTATASTSSFAFGPSSTSGSFSKPFAFGAPSTQSATGFGGVTTASSSGFGNIVSPTPSTGTTSLFGSGATTTFGSSSVTSPFGASGQGASASIFGSSAPATPASMFGSMVPTTAPPAFGSAISSPMFGAANSQSSSMFGASAPQGGQSASTFGNSASSSNQLFTFGSGSGSQPPPAFGSGSGSQQPPAFGSASGSQPPPAFGSGSGSQQPPAFGSGSGSQQPPAFGSGSGSQPPPAFGSGSGSQPPPAFGSSSSGAFGGAAAAGSSLFGTKPAVPSFNTATANPPSLFGASVQSPASASSGFGSSFGISNTFGAQPQSGADKPSFGAASSGFGTSSVSSFGATPQSSVFGASSQNSAPNLFGAAPQNPPPAFGSQSGSAATLASSPFGGSTGGVNVFGAAKPNPFGATAASQANFNFASAQPNMFNTQPANSGFNFNQQNSQPAPSNPGFNFGAQTPTRPTLPAPAPGGFNFAATAAGSAPPAFNFSANPNTPNPFTPQTPGAVPRPRAAARRATRRGGARR